MCKTLGTHDTMVGKRRGKKRPCFHPFFDLSFFSFAPKLQASLLMEKVANKNIFVQRKKRAQIKQWQRAEERERRKKKPFQRNKQQTNASKFNKVCGFNGRIPTFLDLFLSAFFHYYYYCYYFVFVPLFKRKYIKLPGKSFKQMTTHRRRRRRRRQQQQQ